MRDGWGSGGSRGTEAMTAVLVVVVAKEYVLEVVMKMKKMEVLKTPRLKTVMIQMMT